MVWLPGSAAVAVAAIVFGAAHFYLGWKGAVQATVAGAVFCVAYLLTESLWVVIVVHAMVDITIGLTGSAALDRTVPDAASEGRDNRRE